MKLEYFEKTAKELEEAGQNLRSVSHASSDVLQAAVLAAGASLTHAANHLRSAGEELADILAEIKD